VFGCLGVLAVGSFLPACNALLGISPASLAPDSGAGDGGVSKLSSYAVDCNNYCQLMAQNCTVTATGSNLEYLQAPDDAGRVCMSMCNEFEVTAETTTAAVEPSAANTLNCRVWHANAAGLGDPHLHCPHSGPLGGNLCANGGDPCEPFCRMDVDFCTGDAAAYASLDDCLVACRPNPDAGTSGFPYRVSVLDPEVTDLAVQFQSASNTLNCRLYHLENFLRTGDPVHCTHTTKSGGGVCMSADGG
jgi:hypothetical protein